MDKVGRFFMRRLQQDTRRKTRRAALANGLLMLKIVEWNGSLVRHYAPAFDTSRLTMNLEDDVVWLRKQFGSYLQGSREVVSPKPSAVGFGDAAMQGRFSAGRLYGLGRSHPETVDSAVKDEDWHRSYAVRLVGEAGASPLVSHMITALMLARAMRDRCLALRDAMRLLRSPAPFVAIQSEIDGVEDQIVRLIEETGIAGGNGWNFANGGMGHDRGEYYPDEDKEGRRAVHYDSHGLSRITSESMRRRLVNTLSRDMPILATSDRPDKLPDMIMLTSDLNLFIRRIDRTLIEDIVTVIYGEVGRAVFAKLPEKLAVWTLTFDDLLLAFRPGRRATAALNVLSALAARNAEDEGDGDNNDSGPDGEFDFDLAAASSGTMREAANSSSAKVKTSSSKPKGDDKKSAGRDWRRDKPSGAEVIQPEEIGPASLGAASESVRPPLSVETLSGYGSARDWALGLKADLTDYLAGGLAWADMSTKLLLSGPPGTGKTTFARALCNTLQIPLVVTSVSTWLEGGHLDDVIRRMAKTFEEAKALSPSILFVDEIDGIGKRRPAEREYADYWNAVVNKALELLAGAVKAEGVIVVGATNLPHQIDEALRRAGRLETHIELPRPDIETLAGIWAHHLGGDLARLLAEDAEHRENAPVDGTARPEADINAGDGDIKRSKTASGNNARRIGQ
ncbi:AAA family ATPase [Rhizobium sp. PAMB 3174]